MLGHFLYHWHVKPGNTVTSLSSGSHLFGFSCCRCQIGDLVKSRKHGSYARSWVNICVIKSVKLVFKMCNKHKLYISCFVWWKHNLLVVFTTWPQWICEILMFSVRVSPSRRCLTAAVSLPGWNWLPTM